MVASISLVELTGQISAVEAATRAAAAPAPATLQPVTAAAAAPALAEPGFAASPYDQPGAVLPQPIAVGEAWPRLDPPGVALPQPDRLPQRGFAGATLTPAASVPPAGDAVKTDAADTRAATVEPVALVGAPGSHDSDADAPAAAVDVAAEGTRDAVADQAPPENPSEAILWWRGREPTLTFNQIAARVGRSERTVRRVLDAATPAAPPQPATPEDPVPPSAPTTRRADPRNLSGGHSANGARVEDLAESVTSS